MVSKSEDYINIFRRGFGGAVKTGLASTGLSTGSKALTSGVFTELVASRWLRETVMKAMYGK